MPKLQVMIQSDHGWNVTLQQAGCGALTWSGIVEEQLGCVWDLVLSVLRDRSDVGGAGE